MKVYIVAARDIDRQTHELYSEGFSVFYSEASAEREAKELRKSGMFNQVDIYESEVR
jgi:hypothetical protein